MKKPCFQPGAAHNRLTRRTALADVPCRKICEARHSSLFLVGQNVLHIEVNFVRPCATVWWWSTQLVLLNRVRRKLERTKLAAIKELSFAQFYFVECHFLPPISS